MAFFSTLLSNIDMVLAKSDLSLARRYADLVTDARLRRKVFCADRGRVAPHAGSARADHRCRAAAGIWQPLAGALDRAPLPLHRSAAPPAGRAISRYRAGSQHEKVKRGIHISINGIAAGLRNTG